MTADNWMALTHELGKDFAKRASDHDREGRFVFENYEQLKQHRFFSATIPTEFGGGGLSYSDMCEVIRTMAHYCSSTALAFSMHNHLVATRIWKYRTKGVGAAMLERVAANQLVLVSTGARDWLDSNGTVEAVEGGFLVSGRKHFASQSIAGDIAVTSAPWQKPDGSKVVLHFPVPMKAEGVRVLDDWDVMGMRGTGSQTIVFDQVFVPETAIALERPLEGFHPVWNVVLTVAMPLIMSAYVGIAERAFEIALEIGSNYKRNADHMAYILGKLNNTLLSARSQWRYMVNLTNDIDFAPNMDTTLQILSLKTNVSDAVRDTTAEAMEAIGGQSFYRKNELERLFRDAQAAPFPPMPKWDQYAFTGKQILERKAAEHLLESVS